jgi:hypothetical protein
MLWMQISFASALRFVLKLYDSPASQFEQNAFPDSSYGG